MTSPASSEAPVPNSSQEQHIADDARRKPPPTSWGSRWFMIVLTVFEVGASMLVVHLVKSHGGTDFAAYMWSLIPPAVGALIYWARTRHASGASLAILSFNLMSAAVAFFGSHDSRVLLYKDCFVTGIIAVIFLASLAFPRPLTFWFGQRFATDGSPEGLAWWDGLYRYPEFRSAHRQLTVLWGVIMMVEAGVKAIVIANSSFQAGYDATQVVPWVATGLGIFLSFRLGKRLSKASESSPQPAPAAATEAEDAQ